jgi:hypothetical protein
MSTKRRSYAPNHGGVEMPVMITREHQLKAKLRRGEPLPEVRKWYMEQFINSPEPLYFKDLPQFEQAFCKNMFEAFKAWYRQQEEAGR